MRLIVLATMAAVAIAFTAFSGTSDAGRVYSTGQVKNNSNGRSLVTGRTYYCPNISLNSYHGALDIAAPCGKWALAPLVSKRYYRWYKPLANTCKASYNTTHGLGNYYLVNGSNGYAFVMGHLNSYQSGTRYNNHSAVVGKVGSNGYSTGPHTHMQNQRNWTKHTSWITSYYTANNACGKRPNYNTRVGAPQLS